MNFYIFSINVGPSHLYFQSVGKFIKPFIHINLPVGQNVSFVEMLQPTRTMCMAWYPVMLQDHYGTCMLTACVVTPTYTTDSGAVENASN